MMRDVMQNAGLEIFPEIGLIFFLLGFLFVIVRTALMRSAEAEHAERIPLDEGLAQEEV